MISLPDITQYFKDQIKNNEGLIKNIFLNTCDNEVLASSGGKQEQASILSTLLNDSLYIIKMNLESEHHIDKNERPLEIVMKNNDGNSLFLHNVRNQFILGIEVEGKNEGLGHKIATNILKHVNNEIENVVEWMEDDSNGR